MHACSAFFFIHKLAQDLDHDWCQNASYKYIEQSSLLFQQPAKLHIDIRKAKIEE